MSRAHTFPITSLFLIATVPLAWLACGGGESKPAESPSGDTSASASSDAPADSDSSSPAASASPAETATASATAEATAAAPPPPTFGSTDCGACIDKTCAKPETTCGKNTDCQAVIDSIHSCTGTASSCIEGATPPTAAKPKKLATGVETCAKKALAKACKAKCQ
jgi:hypothetical protein